MNIKEIKKRVLSAILATGVIVGAVQGLIFTEPFKITVQAAKKKYDEQEEFFGGLAAVRWGSYWGYINKKGKVVIPLK